MRKTLIERIEVTAATQATIEFSSIPDTYTDLCLVLSSRVTTNAVGETLNILFNGSSASISSRYLYGAGSGSGITAVSSTLGAFVNATQATASTFDNVVLHFPNYASSNHKSFSSDSVTETNGTTAYQVILAGLWSNTAAINSITLDPASGASFMQYSSASLYGISRYNVAGGSPKATGGIISYDSTTDKWVHVFTASGTFTPSEDLTNVEYVVVAGGGGGGPSDHLTGSNGNRSGGGGAGGYRSSVVGESSGGGGSAESRINLSNSTSYAVTVGAGGTGLATSLTNGNDSSFDSITSIGGGAGGGLTTSAWINGSNGGSGGGASEGGTDAGTGTAGQGFNGGAIAQPQGAGGGGGGAGGAGGNAPNVNTGGNGGVGLESSITGSAVYRAGGGGGTGVTAAGTGGAGGGGNANNTSTGDAGSINTGGGGGSGSRDGGSGGSGIVIVRYAA